MNQKLPKQKKTEEDIVKLKGEFQKCNAGLESLNGITNHLKENLDKQGNNIAENKINTQKMLDLVNKNVQDKTDNLNSIIENEVKYLKEKIKTIGEMKEFNEGTKIKGDGVDSKVVKELQGKITDLENKMKSYIGY